MNAKTNSARVQSISPIEAWPALPMREWQETYHNLHMWTQIVGKVRLKLTENTNHWWNVPLYVDARGLTTSPIPYGNFVFEIHFDFIDHLLVIDRSDGVRREIELGPRTVAAFYAEFMATLRSLGIDIAIYAKPVEVENPIPFAEDNLYRAYDEDAAHRFWRILVSCDAVFKQFRARFLGKNSPVQFFWGSFDLAVTRFSGRRCGGCCFLLLRCACSRGAGSAAGASGVCVLSPGAERVHPDVRAGARRGIARTSAAGVFAKHLRGCSGIGELEP